MIDTSLDSSNFYFLLAVVQGIVLSFIIIFQRPFRRAHIFFGTLIFLFSLSLLHLLLEESIHAFNSKYPIPMDFSFAYGPLAYLHVLYIKNPRRLFGWRDWLHFLPAILMDGVFFSAFFLYIRNHMDWAYAHLTLIQSISLVIACIGLIQLFIYTLLIYKESNQARPILRKFAMIRSWLKYMLASWSVIIGFLLIAVPLALLFIDQFDDNSYLIYKPYGLLIGLCIYLLGYMYLMKYLKAVNSYTDKSEKFNFTAAELEAKQNQVLKALEEEKLYQDSAINLAKMAGHLGWPINTLSTTINEVLRTNFNDLINKYRIEAFKELVTRPESEKYSITGLGQEVGFSSKASFYRAFKKETGMTPSDFLQSKVSK